MNCTSINFEGKEIKFSSDLELDLFLESIRDKYHIVNSDASLSVDMQKTTEEKLKSITDMVKIHEVEEHRINEDGDTETYFKIPGSLGTTKAIQTITIPGGTSPLVTPFDKNGYFDKMRKELKEDGFTDAQIEARIKDIENLWKTLTEYGTEIHSLFESIIKDDPSLYQQKYLSDNTVANLSERIKEFITHLRNIHGPKCKLLTEVPLMTNEIAEPYSSVMDSINGRADLIVIDEAGVAHIYDFKVSRKEVGEWHQMDNHTIKAYNWWHSTKKKTAGYQLAFYRAMLKQHGINVGTTAVVPVKIDPEYDSNNEYVSTGIRAAGLDVDSIITSPTSMAQQNIVNDIIPVPHIEVDLTEVSEDMNKLFGEYGVSAKVQRYDARVASTKKRLMHLVSAEDRHYQEGFRFSYFDRFKGKTKYFKTEEELDESLEKYVETINEEHGNEIAELSEYVYRACQGSITLDELGQKYAGTDIEGYVKQVFRPYVLNG